MHSLFDRFFNFFGVEIFFVSHEYLKFAAVLFVTLQIQAEILPLAKLSRISQDPGFSPRDTLILPLSI